MNKRFQFFWGGRYPEERLLGYMVTLMIAKTWQQPKCPLINDWIENMWYICTMQYYSAIRKDEMLSLATTWIDFENIILNKVNHTEKGKNHMISLICGI